MHRTRLVVHFGSRLSQTSYRKDLKPSPVLASECCPRILGSKSKSTQCGTSCRQSSLSCPQNSLHIWYDGILCKRYCRCRCAGRHRSCSSTRSCLGRKIWELFGLSNEDWKDILVLAARSWIKTGVAQEVLSYSAFCGLFNIVKQVLSNALPPCHVYATSTKKDWITFTP